MWQVTEVEFQELINEAFGELPKDQTASLKNVAILFQDLPDEEQRITTHLQPNQTLLGLYEGTPLSQRQGTTKILPDKITLFKIPLEYKSVSRSSLKKEIKHTLWHEIAHYYGLNHDQISTLEG